MKNKSSGKLRFHSIPVISDKTEKLLEVLQIKARDEAIRRKEQDREDRRLRIKARHDRILKSSKDKYLHAIDLIIEYTKAGILHIRYYDFNFENRDLLDSFLSRLQDKRCFENFNGTVTEYAQGVVYMFKKVDLDNLKKIRKTYEVKAQKTMELDDTPKFTKKQKEKFIKGIIKLCKLVGKEAELIRKLGDMEKHTLNELSKDTKRKALSQLKSTVKKKIEKIGCTIKLYKGGWGIESEYQLLKLN